MSLSVRCVRVSASVDESVYYVCVGVCVCGCGCECGQTTTILQESSLLLGVYETPPRGLSMALGHTQKPPCPFSRASYGEAGLSSPGH